MIKRRSIKQIKKIIARWKRIKGCCHCGTKGLHPCQYDLDHLDKDKKIRKRGSWRSIHITTNFEYVKEQIKHCQILCKNCHSLKTYLLKEHTNRR